MKKPITILLLFATVLFLTSCEGYRCADGIVKDKLTNLPLDSVLINVTSSGERVVYTDTTGTFDVCNRMGGCVPECKRIVVTFSKDGYKTVTLTNPERQTIVQLEQ